MKFDGKKEIVDWLGKPVKLTEDSEENLTLEFITLFALQQVEKEMSGEEKVKRYRLSHKIANKKSPVELSRAECDYLKEIIGKYVDSVLIVGRVHDALDGVDDDVEVVVPEPVN